MDATEISHLVLCNFCLTGCALGISCKWAFSVVTFVCDILHLMCRPVVTSHTIGFYELALIVVD